MWIKKKEKNLKNKNFPKHEKFSKNLKKLQKKQKRKVFLKKKLKKNWLWNFLTKILNFKKNEKFSKKM